MSLRINNNAKIIFVILFLLITSGNLHAQKDPYQTTLQSLCDVLLTTQINGPTDPNFGALVCPSLNPENHPIHSRAAEAVYPFAIAYKLTKEVRYRDAAIKLGNWLIKIQQTEGKNAGGWSESWPDPEQKGWHGTTTDQLISLAGAYAILKPWLSAAEIEKWNQSMSMAADYIVATFPIGNINYNPTGAATLLYTYKVASKPKQRWLIKADSLIHTSTLDHVTSDNFLNGEGKGVDEGYNIAQSIGYIALYGILKEDVRIRQIAANLLKTHALFVYPNGSIDNSWGTRSFKWNYESGTKTAPGVYFSFALLADMDPEFGAAGLKCLDYLNTRAMQDGWIGYGPHAAEHASSSPPCNYSTFARAQSIALAIEYGPKTKIQVKSPSSSQDHNWYKFFPDMKVAVIRTAKMMATVSAYGEIRRYPRESVCRGGSITNLWYDGFGTNGFMQSSSSSSYQRIEELHMPIEKDLLPLTPRVGFTKDTTYYSNIFEADARMNVLKESDHVKVVAAGYMQTIKGVKSNTSYNLTQGFYEGYLTKEFTVTGESQKYSIVEPIVKDKGTTFKLKNDSTVVIKTAASDAEWELSVISSTIPYKITLGANADKYWSPFPGVNAYPVVISFNTVSAAPQTLKIFLGKK
ncbi:hypothetical protein HDC92_004553 [Pedobacter sp. AK017]|uniref:hypothetical protein n=1 Tax=Pedobacter sp. AK017 TaxID=2723073 RepID=UPI001615D8E6|nr:hypothetical protein [Pedobacter sp. AK017]MBB5440849.1 hypothetical protein [Pedobacter sp. AK017]